MHGVTHPCRSGQFNTAGWLRVFAFVGFTLATTPVPAAPLPDAVYLQEVGRKIATSEPVTAVATLGDLVVTGSSRGVQRLDGDRLIDEPGLTQPVRRLVATRDTLWAMADSGLHRRVNGSWQRVAEQRVADLTMHRGELIAVGGRTAWRVAGDKLESITTNDAPFELTRAFSNGDTLYIHGPGRVSFIERRKWGGVDLYDFPADLGWDWGGLPAPATTDALLLDSRIYLGTARGLGELRGMSLQVIRGDRGLPYEDITSLARGFTNDLWIGTSRGAIRMVGGDFHYFSGQRWLPGERVAAIASSTHTVYVATDRGLGIIRYEPYTLAKKAAYYERHLEEWGQKRLGLTHKLEWDDTLKEFVREISDNDGGYSGDYLAAQSYRYAITKDPVARREAVNSFQAIRWLETMTGIPGLPARAVWAKGERGHKAMHGSGGYPAEWHDTADGKFEWKGDTSSDELCSHFYSVGLFLDFVAQGDEVSQAKSLLGRIASHLIDHRWQLIDADGKPTRWGRWDPEYFLTDEGHFDRGLQCVEILSFMRMAEAVTGDGKFGKAYQQLVDLGYPAHTLRQRQVFPPDSVLHFEDQLAFWCWWNLLRKETDPDLRSLYRRGLERSYEVVRVEKNPWFNFLYGALTGNDCEPEQSVRHLRDWPLDLIVWSYENSHRADLRTPAGYVALKAGIRPFPAREHEPMRWDAWTMKLDGGSGGRDVIEPGGWLLAYWMGRYHGYIAAPETRDPALLTVEHSYGRDRGAKPYDGPPRP